MTANGRSRGGRRRWSIVAVVVAAVGIVAAGTTALIVSGSSVGSDALEQAQRTAAPGLQDLQEAAAARGETVETTWTTVPDPRGDQVQMVTVRLALRPSGRVMTAAFLVTGRRVIPQEGLARQLAARPAG